MSAISKIENLSIKNDSTILLVSNSNKIIQNVEKIIDQLGFVALTTNDAKYSLNFLENNNVSYVLIDVNLVDYSSDDLVKAMRDFIGDRNIPIIILASINDEVKLSSCNKAGCDDFLFEPYTTIALNSRMTSLKQISDLKYLYKDSINEQLVANRILDNALEGRNLHLKDIGILKKTASVFSGDLFLTARHKDGSLNVLLADFTGHGLSAAIGALPVADVFSVMTEKGFELDYILKSINKKLVTLLPTSMFMACSLLNISKDLSRVTVWNGGMPDIYIRAYGSAYVTHTIKSSHIPLGIDEEMVNRFELEVIDLLPGDEFILYTDGLTDALGDDENMFGNKGLTKSLLNSKDELSVFTNIVDAFNKFCGDKHPIDDVTLACIPCTSSLMTKNDRELPR